MSVIGDIFSGIVDGVGAIFGIGKKIVGGITGALTDTGIASLVSVVSDLTTSLDTVVNGIAGALSGIVDPIKNVVTSVSTLTNDIQDKIITPIVEPIAKTITTIEGLTKTVSDLANEGLAGIAKIPGAISDALKGVSDAFAQIEKGTATANKAIVEESMVPGFAGFLGPGLKNVAGGFTLFSDPKGLQPDRLMSINLANFNKDETVKQIVSKYLDKFQNPQTMWDHVGAIFLDALTTSAVIGASMANVTEAALAAAREGDPQTTLDVGSIQTAFQRGILDQTSALTELLRLGYNTDRGQALLETTAWFPTPDQAVDWFNRGLIDQPALTKVLYAQGLNSDDVLALQAAAIVTLPANTLVDWFARGIIQQKDFDDQLRAQGYNSDRILQLVRAGVALPTLDTAINAKANESAASNGWYPSTYASKPPVDVLNIGQASRLDPAEVAAKWSAHFAAMPLQTAINLFFRGELPRDKVKVVVEQNGYPPDMVDLFIASQSALLMPRSIPGLVARGSLAAAEGVTRLQEHGYSIADAQLLIDDAAAVAKAKPKSTASDLTKLTVAELGDAFADGLISKDEYTTLLKSHGFVGSDVDLVVAMKVYTVQRAAMKEQAATIKAEVALGILTVDAAVQQLHAGGFSQGEIDRLQAGFKIEKRKAAKVPDLTLLTRMVKGQLISPQDYLAGVQALGYAAPWDALIVALETSPANVGTTPPTAGPPA